MDEKKKVLITGAAGRIGSRLWARFKDRYDLRLMFHNKIPETAEGEDTIIADICNLDQMLKACESIDAVIHMALTRRENEAESMMANIRGTYNVFEAARQCGVQTVVYGSTNHVMGMYERDKCLDIKPEWPVRPDGLYGAGKAAGEALGRYYSDNYGMSVFCIRIGSAIDSEVPTGRGARILSTWFSYKDMAQMIGLCIDSTDIKFGTFFGISGNTRRFWNISNAQEVLGYAPEDDAEEYAKDILGT